MKKYIKSFIINLGLLFSGFSTVFSGLLIQFQYHIGNHGTDKFSLGLDYSSWSEIHKVSIVILSILAVFHISLHWKRLKWFITTFERMRK